MIPNRIDQSVELPIRLPFPLRIAPHIAYPDARVAEPVQVFGLTPDPC